jgi:DNA-binding MarR family transcriptional regulator
LTAARLDAVAGDASKQDEEHMEFIVQSDGFLTERDTHELAAWYANDGLGQEDFEAHLMLLKAHTTLTSSAQRGRRLPLSVERYSLLRLLYRLPERRLQMAELSRRLGVSATSVTKLVNGLSKLELVHRVPHATDKRRTWIELTPAGASVVEERLPIARATTRKRWQALSRDEKRMLAHLLAKLVLGNQTSEVEPVLEDLREHLPAEPRANGASRTVNR